MNWLALGERAVASLIDYGIFILMAILCFIGGVSVQIDGCIWYRFYHYLCGIVRVLRPCLRSFMNGQSVGKKVMKIKVMSLRWLAATPWAVYVTLACSGSLILVSAVVLLP
jgi:uncharacterized RDD family membrane protein YckC